MVWVSLAFAAEPLVVPYRETDTGVTLITNLGERAERAEETVELRPGVTLTCDIRPRKATVRVTSEEPVGPLPESARCGGFDLAFQPAEVSFSLAGALAGTSPVRVRQGGSTKVVVTNEPGWGEADGVVDAAGIVCRSLRADHFEVSVAAGPDAPTGPALCTIADVSGTPRILHLFVGFAEAGSGTQDTVIHTTGPR